MDRVHLDTGAFRRLREAMRRARRARVVEVDATLVPVRGTEGILRPAPTGTFTRRTHE